jgi:hypothetical protein
MPRVSEFFGIVIYFYYNDHLPPHFHAEYSGSEALIEIDTLRILRGKLPRRVHGMVLEWADLHRTELLENWRLAQAGKPLSWIEPLE